MQCTQPSTSKNENIPSAGLAKGRQVSLHTPAFVGTHRWVLCAIDALAVSQLPLSLSCNHIQSSDSILEIIPFHKQKRSPCKSSH